MIPMLIAGLALWAGQAFAQPSKPPYSVDGLYNLANSYARSGKPGLRCSATSAPHCWRQMIGYQCQSCVRSRLRTCVSEAAEPLCAPREAASPTSAAWLGVLGIALVGIGLVARWVAPRFLWIPGAVSCLASR